MPATVTPFVALYTANAAVAVFVAALVLRRRRVPGSVALGLMQLAVAEWSIGRAFEISAPLLTERVLWSKIEYLDILLMTPLLLIFAVYYSGHAAWLQRGRVGLLFVVPAITAGLAATNEWHGLVWNRFTYDPTSIDLLNYGHGPAFWIGVVGYAYALTLAAALLMVQAATRWHRAYRPRTLILIAAILIPWLANLVYLFRMGVPRGVDMSPVAFMISGALAAYVLLHYGLQDIVPVARSLLIEELADGVLVIDQQRRLIDANPAACQMIGALGAPDLGHSLSSLPDPWPDLLDRVTGPQSMGVECAIPPSPEATAADGIQWVEVRARPLSDPSVGLRGHLIVLRSITERKRAEEQVQRLNAELEQRVSERTARLEERTRQLSDANARLQELDQLKSKFIAGVSHELRTPLANVVQYLSLLERGKPDKQAHYLATAQAQAAQLTTLVEGILDLSRLDEERQRPATAAVDLNLVAAAVVEKQRAGAEAAGLKLVFAPAAGLPPIAGDGRQLDRMVGNLIHNALSYTAEGSVTVSTWQDAEEDSVYLEVADTGRGIDAVDLPHVFDRFYRGKNASQSTQAGVGLGLAIVKEIVEAHNATIEVHTGPGGATFRIRFPALPRRRPK